MDATRLVGLASAHGIDFGHVAGASSDVDGIARERPLTREERELGIREVQVTVKGRETRSARRTVWSAAELARAAAGLPLVPWLAAMYSIAGARDGYHILKLALAEEGLRIAKREHWPSGVTRRNVRWRGMLDGDEGLPQNYKEDLAELVLIEDANRQIFASAPALFAVVMEVSPGVWEDQLLDPYRSLKGRYEGWLRMARAWIGRRLRENGDASAAEIEGANVQR